jgi:hypothetical protein
LGKRRRGQAAEEEGEFWARLGQPVEAEPGPYWAAERGRTQATYNRFQEANFFRAEKAGRVCWVVFAERVRKLAEEISDFLLL